MHIRAKHAAENLTNLVERELAGEGHDALRRISLMAAEQIRSDRRTEKRFGPRRTILTAAQGLRFFSESPVALPILLFQCHATAKMRGCLRPESRLRPLMETFTAMLDAQPLFAKVFGAV